MCWTVSASVYKTLPEEVTVPVAKDLWYCKKRKRIKILVATLIVGCYPGRMMYLEVKCPHCYCWTWDSGTKGTAVKLNTSSKTVSWEPTVEKAVIWSKDPVFLIFGELACLYGLGEVGLPSQALLHSAEKLQMGGKLDLASQLYFLG